MIKLEARLTYWSLVSEEFLDQEAGRRSRPKSSNNF